MLLSQVQKGQAFQFIDPRYDYPEFPLIYTVNGYVYASGHDDFTDPTVWRLEREEAPGPSCYSMKAKDYIPGRAFHLSHVSGKLTRGTIRLVHRPWLPEPEVELINV